MSAAVVSFDVLRDSRHRDARAAPEQRAWLDYLELGGIRPRTLEDYEWATALALRMFPKHAFAEFTDLELGAVFKKFPAGSRRVRVAAYRSWFKWGRTTRRITDEIQLLLGHESIRTTSDLYVHTDISDVAAHMAEIEAGEE